MKGKVRAARGHSTVRIRLSSAEEIAERDLGVAANKYLIGVQKPAQKRKRLFEYSLPAAVSLKKRMEKPVGKADFLMIMAQIVNVYRRMESNNLNPGVLLYGLEYVFVNETTQELYFLLLPLKTRAFSEDAVGLLTEIIYNAKPADEVTRAAITDFSFLLRGLDSFDTQAIGDYITSQDSGVAKRMSHMGIGSGYLTDKRQEYLDHYDEEDYDVPTGLLNSDDDNDSGESTGILDFDDATGLLDDTDIGLFGSTDNHSSDNSVKEKKRSLKRSSTGETVNIDKPVFRIGQDAANVDYCVKGNGKVSRTHAEIVCRKGKTYLKDLRSKNGTRINGAMVPGDTETELYDKDIILLADEEFVFNYR